MDTCHSESLLGLFIFIAPSSPSSTHPNDQISNTIDATGSSPLESPKVVEEPICFGMPMVRSVASLTGDIADFIILLVRRLAINSPMAPSAFHEFSRARTHRVRELVTTDRFWRHHNHDGMNFCETESRMRMSNDAMSGPSQFSDRVPKESRSWPLRLDFLPTISSTKLPIVRCESPIAIWECEGDCRNKYIETPEAAHVVSYILVDFDICADYIRLGVMKVCISACKDAQRAWEGPEGASITMVCNAQLTTDSLLIDRRFGFRN